MENRPLYRAMNKYGADKFNVSLLEEADANILGERETYWIKKLDTYHYGYNATLGGDGIMIYNDNAFIEDFQKGMTLKEIADKNGCCVDTVRDRVFRNGYDVKQNSRKYIEKEVLQLDKDGNYIQTFKSYHEAARYLIKNGESTASEDHLAYNIRCVAVGKRKSCLGYLWKLPYDDNFNLRISEYTEKEVLQFDKDGNYIRTFKSCYDVAQFLINTGKSKSDINRLTHDIRCAANNPNESYCEYFWEFPYNEDFKLEEDLDEINVDE